MYAALFLMAMVIFSPQSQATSSTNLADMAKKFFPAFNDEKLTVLSKNGHCKLTITQSNEQISFSVAQGDLTPNNFTSSVVMVKENKLVEAAGRQKDEGFYAYSNFYGNDESLTVVKGLSYYTPSYEVEDSSENIIQEQKMILSFVAEGVSLVFTERAPERPKLYNCLF